MTKYSPGPFMKMSPSGLPGLLVVLFVVFTSCAFFGVQFLWVLLGLGALGIGLWRPCFVPFIHGCPKTWGYRSSHTLPRRVIVQGRFLKPVRNLDGIIPQIP